MAYIERETLKQNIRLMPRTSHPELVHYSMVQKVIFDTPAADVVEVVRCKDCKHLMFSDMYGECSQAHMGIVRPDDFCSYGERKDGE